MLVLQGNRILEVGSAVAVRAPAKPDRVIDVTGAWIVPGLIDLHMHFQQQRGDDFTQYGDSVGGRGDSPASYYRRNSSTAGITTVSERRTVDDVGRCGSRKPRWGP